MPTLLVNGVCTLTRDAEVVKAKTGNSAWVKFGLAAHRKYAKEGQQDVDFFDAEYHMKNTESTIASMLTKGRRIYLDRAELRNDQFMGTDGTKKSKVKIMVFSFDFLDAKPKADDIIEEPIKDKTISSPALEADAIAQMYKTSKKTKETPPYMEEPEEEIPF